MLAQQVSGEWHFLMILRDVVHFTLQESTLVIPCGSFLEEVTDSMFSLVLQQRYPLQVTPLSRPICFPGYYRSQRSHDFPAYHSHRGGFPEAFTQLKFTASLAENGKEAASDPFYQRSAGICPSGWIWA